MFELLVFVCKFIVCNFVVGMENVLLVISNLVVFKIYYFVV